MAETVHKRDFRPPQKPSPLERSITAGILKWLNTQPECFAIKTRGDQRQQGQPDILGCIGGRTIAFEVKRPGKGPTVLQKVILGKWRRAGAIAGVVHSLDEAKELLRSDGDG